MSSRWKAKIGVRVEGGELWGDYFTSFCSYLSVFAGYAKLRLGGMPCFVFCLFRAYSYSSEAYHCFTCTRDTHYFQNSLPRRSVVHTRSLVGDLCRTKEQIHYHRYG